MIYVIIYLWMGERHRYGVDFSSKIDALQKLKDMRGDKWNCWIEEIAR